MTSYFTRKRVPFKRESYLPQTDRALAFVVDRVIIFPTSSLITVQNLFAVSHTVRPHVGGSQNFFGDAGAPRPLGRGRG